MMEQCYKELKSEYERLNEKMQSQLRYCEWLKEAALHAPTEEEFWQFNEKIYLGERAAANLADEAAKAYYRMIQAEMALRGFLGA